MTKSWYHSAPLTAVQVAATLLPPLTTAVFTTGALPGAGLMLALKLMVGLHGPQPI